MKRNRLPHKTCPSQAATMSLLRRRPILRKPISLDQLKIMIDSLFPDAPAKAAH